MLHEITKGMDNAAQSINENFQQVQLKENPDWTTSNVLMANFTGTISYRKIGNLVHVRGSFRRSSGGRIDSAQTIFVLPAEVRPGYDVWTNCVPHPGTTSYPESNAAVASISSNGNLVVQRATDALIQYWIDTVYTL